MIAGTDSGIEAGIPYWGFGSFGVIGKLEFEMDFGYREAIKGGAVLLRGWGRG